MLIIIINILDKLTVFLLTSFVAAIIAGSIMGSIFGIILIVVLTLVIICSIKIRGMGVEVVSC